MKVKKIKIEYIDFQKSRIMLIKPKRKLLDFRDILTNNELQKDKTIASIAKLII